MVQLGGEYVMDSNFRGNLAIPNVLAMVSAVRTPQIPLLVHTPHMFRLLLQYQNPPRVNQRHACVVLLDVYVPMNLSLSADVDLPFQKVKLYSHVSILVIYLPVSPWIFYLFSPSFALHVVRILHPILLLHPTFWKHTLPPISLKWACYTLNP